MAGQSHEASVKLANTTILILAAITIFEVLFALVGKGHIGNMSFSPAIMGGVMIILSLVKAWLIIFEFMHMKYEAKGLVRTVLLPLILLVWAIIAFLMEGDYWQESRDQVKANPEHVVKTNVIDASTKHIKDTHHGDHSGGTHQDGGHH